MKLYVPAYFKLSLFDIALPTRKVLTVVDACFSAGMYLDPAEEALAGAVPKFMVKGCLGKVLPVGKKRRGPRLKGALLSAAAEKEQAWEIPGQGGAFTTRWIKNLQAKPRAGLKTVFARTRRDVIKRTGKRQHPQARGHAAGLFE